MKLIDRLIDRVADRVVEKLDARRPKLVSITQAEMLKLSNQSMERLRRQFVAVDRIAAKIQH